MNRAPQSPGGLIPVIFSSKEENSSRESRSFSTKLCFADSSAYCQSDAVSEITEIASLRILKAASASPRSALVRSIKWLAAAPNIMPPHGRSSARISGSSISNCHRISAERNCAVSRIIDSIDCVLAVRHSIAADIRRAMASLSRTIAASPRCSANWSSASRRCSDMAARDKFCWCSLDLFSTRTATQAATAAARMAAGIAPSAPDHTEIHASLSNPQNMGLSLREAC